MFFLFKSAILAQIHALNMYQNCINRTHRTSFVIMIDQSGSMQETVLFGCQRMTKAEGVALAANTFIDEIISRSRRDGGIYDYYDIAVIGYSGDGVQSLLGEGWNFTQPSRLAARQVRKAKRMVVNTLPDGGQIMTVSEHNAWIEPQAVGGTPMYEAFSRVLDMVSTWCRKPANADSYPPTVINITDGEGSDADSDKIREITARIKTVKTSDGGVLLFNMHLCGEHDTVCPSVLFPSDKSELPDKRYARLLYDISSQMPETYNSLIAEIRPGGKPPYKGMSYNCSLSNIADVLNIGSVSINII